ncbi:MAG TPA: hypothetical protein VGM98_00420 [Schlesneria sp.]|jgi:hypothetical protein
MLGLRWYHYAFAVAVLGLLIAMRLRKDPQRLAESRHVVEGQLSIDSRDVIEFVQRRLTKIAVTESDGRISMYDIPSDKPKVQDRTLTSPEKLLLPDHHGTQEFALVSVIDNKATIAYLLVTDLRSFRDNRTLVRAGTVTLEVLPRHDSESHE